MAKATRSLLLMFLLVFSLLSSQCVPLEAQGQANAWDDYVAALYLLPGADTDERGVSDRWTADAEFERLYGRLDRASVGEVEAAVAAMSEVLDALLQGLGKPCNVDWPESQEGDGPVATMGGRAKSLARLLAVKAWSCHQRGDDASALSSLRDALTFGRALATAMPAGARDAGHDCIVIACRRAQKVLSSATDGVALTAFIEHLQATRAIVPDYERAVDDARASARRMLYTLEGEPIPDGEDEEFTRHATTFYRIIAGFDPDPEKYAAHSAQLEGAFAEATKIARRRGHNAMMMSAWRRAGKGLDVELLYARSIRRGLSGPAGADDQLCGTLLMAALQLFHGRHDRYPDLLYKLAPDLLEETPVDPFSGRVYDYARNDAGGYTLYGTGENGLDDGGDPFRGLDTVFMLEGYAEGLRRVESDNAWDYYRAALALLPETAAWEGLPYVLSEASVEDVDAAVADAADALAVLREGLGKPFRWDWPVTREDALRAMKELSAARSMARLLRVETWAHQVHGNDSAALASCIDALHFSVDLSTEAPPMRALTAWATAQIGTAAATRILETAEDSEAVASFLDQMNGLRDARPTLPQTISCLQRDVWARLDKHAELLVTRPNDTAEGILEAYGVELRANQFDAYRQLVDAIFDEVADVAAPGDYRATHETINMLMARETLGRYALSEARLMVSKAAESDATFEVVRVAAALRIHFLENGQYPESLAGLAPAILTEVPLDPCSGEELAYERLGPDRCFVYSVGWDMTDERARKQFGFPRWSGDARGA